MLVAEHTRIAMNYALKVGDLFMRPRGKSVLLLAFVACMAGCGKGPESTSQPKTAGDLAADLVAHAQTNDLPFFAGLLDATVSNQASKLVSMIQRSGMETNYLGRLRKDLGDD